MENGSHQAFQTLRLAFTIAPIIMGLDKFLGLLTPNWEKYLAPQVSSTLGIQPHTFMLMVGVVEIIAGLVVAVAPRFGGYLVMAWLAGIIVNLLLVGGYLDVAVRDLGLAMAAFALARLAEAEAHVKVATPARA